MTHDDLTLISIFIMGLLSGVHCMGMCGGIVSALALGSQQQNSTRQTLLIQLLYNLGRISSYTIAGLIMGWLGAITTQSVASHTLHQSLQTLSGIILILMGLYLANWWRILTRLEQVGAYLWRRIEPFARRLIPIKSPRHAIAVGMLWGWLPCGLVYSMLTLSLTSASASQGALVMLLFGLGTLPNLLAMGVMAVSLQRFLKQPVLKSIAGIFVAGFGMYLILDVWGLWPFADAGSAHQHHQHH